MPKSKERCSEIREEMCNLILQKSLLYFARNGFAGTRISDLSKDIGIAQGTIYTYFESKEELFNEVYKITDDKKSLKEMKLLSHLPVCAEMKIRKLSELLLDKIEKDIKFAASVALNTQLLLEGGTESSSKETTYKSGYYMITAKIFMQGQSEGSVVNGSAMKLADYYWGVIYLYSLKRLFTSSYEMITTDDLNRIVLTGGNNHAL